MAKKILNYNEVLDQLRQGNYIIYLGSPDPSASMPMDNDFTTVRLDTLYKLAEQGLVTHFGYPYLHNKVYLKEQK